MKNVIMIKLYWCESKNLFFCRKIFNFVNGSCTTALINIFTINLFSVTTFQSLQLKLVFMFCFCFGLKYEGNAKRLYH